MGPELLAATALGTAVTIALSAVAGWLARAKVSDAVEALLLDENTDLRASIIILTNDASRSHDASVGVLDAANRRAGHDSDADPLGIGLLRGTSDAEGVFTLPPSGEAVGVGDGGDRPGGTGPPIA